MRVACLWVLFTGLSLSACSSNSGNFSQYPGFGDWYAANPPSQNLPTAYEQQLLGRYQPRLFVATDSGRPIRFYEDYIAQGDLHDAGGKQISGQVDQALLNQHSNDPGVIFTHRPNIDGRDTKPAADVIARIDRETLPANGTFSARKLIFLTYHYVFATSGVAAGIRPWQRFLIDVFASTTDWHQLDHYTAVSVVLDESTQRPLALMLQQHNYLRTWILAPQKSPGRTQLPSDGRVAVVAARDSNELYLSRDDVSFRRAVPMLTPDNVRWLVMGQDRPWVTADDVTEAVEEVTATLKFLPPSDAFFTFKGWLGERRLTPGRDGPPGADFNTLPGLMPRARQLALYWWSENDANYVDLIESREDRDTTNLEPFLDRLHQALPPPASPSQGHAQDQTMPAPGS